MTKSNEDLKATLLLLSRRERGELAHLLISSLDDTIDADAETEWDEELAKRVKQIEEGTAIGTPAFEALDEISKTYRKKQSMSESAERLIEQALNLSTEERSAVAERLLTSLEPDLSNLDILRAQEAEDRLDAYERGEIKAIPAEEVFNSIKNRKR